MDWTLSVFQSITEIDKQVIALSAEDEHANDVLSSFPRIIRVKGGAERADSVVSALSCLAETESDDDWILVHDVARPCVQVSDIEKLMQHCQRTGHGAVLGHPVTDTIKCFRPGESIKTIDRSSLWAVQTPQCFRLGDLLKALRYCSEQALPVTDEASAMEQLGLVVDIVEGDKSNIKLTHAADQALVAFYLQQQGRL